MSTFLQFSGGKDSLACLYLLEKQWDEITVVWVNTGAAFPETIDQMEHIRAIVPHFLEVKTAQNIESEGYPTDLLPISHTSMGQQFEGPQPHKFQSRYACCAHALWIPLQREMKERGATRIIRGEKRCDAKRSQLTDGMLIEGITYRFPVYEWSDAEVLAYLREKKVEIPRSYRTLSTGLDCWNCTAYLSENRRKLDYLHAYHPQKFQEVRGILQDLQSIINTQALWELTL